MVCARRAPGSVLEALDRYAAGLRFDMLTMPGRPPLERLRAHFEYLGRDTLDNGFVRGCLAGNVGARRWRITTRMSARPSSGCSNQGR
ncbi:hypothetical protein [Streptomyces flaveolus]|uniref:hypothetical protein n=1 Tax=Streptomyces flaveolus TaxID=67297 RepID=UPI0004BE005C|nr:MULTISPECIES: hypothetical protein [Streptomyces]KOG59575.1 hypothetical protein ADK77_39180 [Streptomyces antibioticus]